MAVDVQGLRDGAGLRTLHDIIELAPGLFEHGFQHVVEVRREHRASARAQATPGEAAASGTRPLISSEPNVRLRASSKASAPEKLLKVLGGFLVLAP